MKRILQLCALLTLLVLTSNAIPLLDLQSSPDHDQRETIHFSKRPVMETQQSQKLSSTHNIDSYNFRGSTPPQAFKSFDALYKDSDEADKLWLLLNEIRTISDWKSKKKYPKAYNAFAHKLIKKALVEKNRKKRATFVEAIQSFSPEYGAVYPHMQKRMFRPGESVVCNINNRRAFKNITYNYILEKIELDNSFKPSGYTKVKSGVSSLHRSYKNISVGDVTEAGLYRLTIYSDYHLHERFFQVTMLDGVVKRDRDKILVYGCSYKDTIAGPYSVQVVSSKDEIFTTETDSNGLAVLNFADTLEAPAIVLEKEGHIAFIGGLGLHNMPDTTMGSYCYTDRPIYRPGQKVYFKALLHRLTPHGISSAGAVEKVQLDIINPEGKVISSRMNTINAWGHVIDSLELSETAEQGVYIIEMHGLTGTSVPMNPYTKQVVQFTVKAYKKPQFKMSAQPQKRTYNMADTVKVDIKGEYFFGGALAKQKVTIRWYKQNIYYSWGGGRYNFYSQGQIGRNSNELLLQEEITLDKEGKATASYVPKSGTNSHYLIAECILTDESRREIRKKVSVRVVEGLGFLFIRPNKYRYTLKEDATFKITAIDLNGDGLKRPIRLRLKRNRKLIKDTTIETDSKGECAFLHTMNHIGNYTLHASMKMDDGSSVKATSYRVQVVKKQVQSYDYDLLRISTDKNRYHIGDTATVTINSGAKDKKLLLTLEGNRLLSYEVVKMGGGTYTCKIPIVKKMGSAIHINGAYSGSRTIVSSAMPVTIVDSVLMLDVTLQAEKNLKPGETFTGTLSIKDKKGDPVFANFSVGLVDEAIFHIPADKYHPHYYRYSHGSNNNKGIKKLFPSYQRPKVHTVYNRFNQRILSGISLLAHRQDKRSPMGAKAQRPRRRRLGFGSRTGSGFGGSGSGIDAVLAGSVGLTRGGGGDPFGKGGASNMATILTEPPRERSDFKDLGYWNSSVTTGKKGEAQISFPMPDDLTKWRLMIIGNDGMSKLIEFTDTLVTKMDLMVKLESPRVLVEGDSLLMTSVVHNYSGKKLETDMTIALKGDTKLAKFPGSTKENLSLDIGATERIDWPLIVRRGGELTAYTEVISASGSDAESRTYPVLSNGIGRSKSSVGVLDTKNDKAELSLAIPEDGREGSRFITLHYAPSMAQGMFESLEYLTGFPYGCVEQTMSRFLPNLYVAETMDNLDMTNDTLLKKIPQYTRKGLERLQKLQHDDGGWGWWASDKSDPRMTALVVYGLNYALKSNHVASDDKAIIREMLRFAQQRVFNFITYNQTQNSEQKINLIYSLQHKKQYQHFEEEIKKLSLNDTALSTKAVAQLVEISHTLEEYPRCDRLVKELLSRAVRSSQGIHWKGSQTYRWYKQDEEATAQVLKALHTVGKNPLEVSLAVQWLSQKKRNGYWVSTKTTAAVLNAIASYLSSSRELSPNFTVTISLDGKELKKLTINRDNMARNSGEVVLKEADLKEKSRLHIEFKGEGKFFYSLVHQYTTNENPIKAKSNGITLTRSYKKIDYSKNARGEWQVRRIPFNGVCKSGDEIEVTVTMKCKSNYEHVMVEDFFPAGMEVLKKSQDWYNRWCGWWWRGYDNREARDDRMVFFMSWANKGTTTMTYLLRAETPGRFTALPTQAECMYEPEINGNSEAMTVLINN